MVDLGLFVIEGFIYSCGVIKAVEAFIAFLLFAVCDCCLLLDKKESNVDMANDDWVKEKKIFL